MKKTTLTVTDSQWMNAGDVIEIDGECFTISTVDSNTSVTVKPTRCGSSWKIATAIMVIIVIIGILLAVAW